MNRGNNYMQIYDFDGEIQNDVNLEAEPCQFVFSENVNIAADLLERFGVFDEDNQVKSSYKNKDSIIIYECL